MMGRRFDERFQLDDSLARETGFNPYYCKIGSGLSDPMIVQEEKFINLASNNYLGLADDPRVKEAAAKALYQYGTSLCGTPIATGYIDLFEKVEKALATFVGLEASIILPSCYQANNGLFVAIAGKEDLVLVDHYAHSSLVEGIKAVGCKIRPFLHNNMDHLAKILEQSVKYRQTFIVTESVFSTDGSIAPLKEMVALAQQYDAVPVVDDSHGIGVIGETGRGVLEACEVREYPGIYTASLGKGLANAGGMIAGSKKIIDYLRYYCPHLVYSTALPPSSLGGIEEVLRIIQSEFGGMASKMWRYKEALTKALVSSGFHVADGKAPITSIISGDAEETIRIAKRFFEKKILTTPFIPPSVPRNEGRVRLIAGANLKEESMEQIGEAIQKMGEGQ